MLEEIRNFIQKKDRFKALISYNAAMTVPTPYLDDVKVELEGESIKVAGLGEYDLDKYEFELKENYLEIKDHKFRAITIF